MANEKIINLDNLKKFRQEYDTRISGGAIPVGKALTAKQLEPVSEESGSIQTTPFLFQATSTDNNTTSTPTAPIAKHLELRGNTVIWNQLHRVVSKTSRTTNGITFSVNTSTKKYTISGTATDRAEFTINSTDLPLVAGHKILVKTREDVKLSLVYYRGDGSSYVSYHDFSDGDTHIVPSNVKLALAKLVIENGVSFAEPIETYVQVFDITKIRESNLLAFNRDYTLPYYEFNVGTPKSCKSRALETIKQNQFQELNAFIEVIAGAEYYISGISAGGYIEEYDGAKNLIKTSNEITSAATIELSENTHYVKVQATTYTDIMLCVYWGDGEDYSHKPFGKYEYPLPEVELRSAGDAYDVLYSNGTGKRRIGYVDLGTLNWSYVSSGTRFISSSLNGTIVKGTGYGTKVPNILCARYSTIGNKAIFDQTRDDVISLILDNQITYVAIRDTDYTDANQFKNSLSGVILYYELLEEEDILASQFAENAQVDDMGTMKYIPSADNLEPVIPQGNRFFYPIDVSMFIDDLYKRSKDGGTDADVDNFVTQSELQTAIGQIPTGDFGFPIITAPSSNVLTDEQIAQIRSKGAVIVGNISNWGSWQKYILFPCGEEYSGRYFGYCVLTRNGFSHIEQYSINPTDKTIATYGSKYIDLDSGDNLSLNGLNKINGKNIPAYPSSTGTFVLKCVNGTLTWVVE